MSGLSPVVTNPTDSASRGSVGLGFTGDGSAGTMAHEVGHAHGRSHAPCGGASGVDPGFPYSGGAIGTWGYSAATKQLMDPAQTKDVMPGGQLIAPPMPAGAVRTRLVGVSMVAPFAH